MAASQSVKPSSQIYASLNPSKREIRILQTHPGSKESELRGRLVVVSLDKHPQLKSNALSYTWGMASKVNLATIETSEATAVVKITDNYHKALLRLRPRLVQSTPLWVDALCINQQDDEEKSIRVAMMAEIYIASKCTLVWLGDERTMTVSETLRSFFDLA